jgi:uncharacterized protein YlbG (UPF0298 family)
MQFKLYKRVDQSTTPNMLDTSFKNNKNTKNHKNKDMEDKDLFAEV